MEALNKFDAATPSMWWALLIVLICVLLITNEIVRNRKKVKNQKDFQSVIRQQQESIGRMKK